LLTYETAVPQEGRIRQPAAGREFRVSTFPTIFGEKVVIRVLSAGSDELQRLADLGLPELVDASLAQSLRATSGGLIIAGPAGSGKTTTAYACLREITALTAGGRSIASLEDPVEVVVPGAVQSQVSDAAGFDMATGLRSLLRQDPEVILIGEIRDRTTAEIALQAALTGQLVVTTFHAGSCAEVVHRLVDMGLPGYAIRNAIRLIVTQRLLRRLCSCCATADPAEAAQSLGLEVGRCSVPIGCDDCQQTGYRGRVLIAEALSLDAPETRAALTDTAGKITLSPTAGRDLWSSATALVESGVTSPAEVVRVLGWKSRE
jgi:type II secretory ATPase GspE/PulE/Tfp pilus assembly ATPase PilB-like protein